MILPLDKYLTMLEYGTMIEKEATPIKRRRDREREQRRQNILLAARTIAAEEGWNAVTIRKVADRIEYSPPTIYEHFASKEAILLDLMREGFAALLQALRTARTAAPDPEAALVAMAHAYWEFAWQRPELYQVMHGLGGVPFCGDVAEAKGGLPEPEQVFDEVLLALAAFTQATGADVGDPDEAVEIIWATSHGLIALTMSDHLDGGRERGAHLAERAMRTLLAAWRNGEPH
jgi:AcrR family transcriptional regulator